MSAAGGERDRVAAVFRADHEVGATSPRSTGRPPRSDRRASGRRACRPRSSILLSSRFPMWMAWGPELTFFCNAAYRRDTLGRKYPWALGRPGQRGVGGDLGRHRPADRRRAVHRRSDLGRRRCCCSWSGPATRRRPTTRSPTARCATTTAQVVGMLCVVSEDTERVIGERRMATLRDLGLRPERGPHRAGDARLRRPPARPQPARPAVHPDLPVRRRRRREPGGLERHRRRAPGGPGAFWPADGAGLWPVAEAAPRRVGAGATRRRAVRRTCRPATGPSRPPRRSWCRCCSRAARRAVPGRPR